MVRRVTGNLFTVLPSLPFPSLPFLPSYPPPFFLLPFPSLRGGGERERERERKREREEDSRSQEKRGLKKWRKLRGFKLLAEVIRGVQFKDGEPIDSLKECEINRAVV
jgi:hypothetical protein